MTDVYLQGVHKLEVHMRILTLGLTAATAAFLMTGGFAHAQSSNAQNRAAPEKAQGGRSRMCADGRARPTR